MTNDLDTLRYCLEEEACQPVDPLVAQVVSAVRQRHGNTLSAVLFYGSCLRSASLSPAPNEGVIDLYVLVDRYRDLYGAGLTALANTILPPNVFYLELAAGASTVRAKYAVVSLGRFCRNTSGRAFHPSLWARFCQPTRLVYVRDEAAKGSVIDALADAVVTMVGRTVPLMEDDFTAAQLWQRAFQETYRTELRVEETGRAGQLYAWDTARYDSLTRLALAATGHVATSSEADARYRIATSAFVRTRSRLAWAARRWVGKPLTVLRLIKGAFTFDGAVDYILWKIERHSGIRPRVTAWQRRHPVLASPLLVWRLYRQRTLR